MRWPQWFNDSQTNMRTFMHQVLDSLRIVVSLTWSLSPCDAALLKHVRGGARIFAALWVTLDSHPSTTLLSSLLIRQLIAEYAVETAAMSSHNQAFESGKVSVHRGYCTHTRREVGIFRSVWRYRPPAQHVSCRLLHHHSLGAIVGWSRSPWTTSLFEHWPCDQDLQRWANIRTTSISSPRGFLL